MPWSQVLRQVKRSDGFAVERGKTDAVEPVKHALDLMVSSLDESDSGRPFFEEFETGGSGRDALGGEPETDREAGGGILGNGPVGVDEIDLFNHLGGVGKGGRPSAVVAEQDESGGAAVEPPGEMEGGFVGMIDEIEDRAMDRVRGGAEDACGFVQHYMEAWYGGLDRFPVANDPDEPVDRASRVTRGLAVDRHKTSENRITRALLADLQAFADELSQGHGRRWPFLPGPARRNSRGKIIPGSSKR